MDTNLLRGIRAVIIGQCCINRITSAAEAGTPHARPSHSLVPSSGKA